MAITPLPTAPSRDDPSTFSSRADAFLGALPTFATEANALATGANADAATATTKAAEALSSKVAAEAAKSAAESAANVSVWVSGTTYLIGDVRYSPIDFKSYRRKTAGAGATDPSSDATNWAAIGTDIQKLKIFETAAASLTPVSAMETLENNSYSTGLGVTPQGVCFGNGLFVCYPQTALSNVATSPDGETWTLRGMPTNAAWQVGTDGTNFIGTYNSNTAVAVSANGTSWSNGTSLPGATDGAYSRVIFNGSVGCVMGSASTTTLYKTINAGASWTTETLPVARGSAMLAAVGGVFLYWTSGSTYYTSATGATGSWTARTFPASGTLTFMTDFDGSLLGHVSSAGNTIYRTTNGIDWVSTGLIANDMNCTINGIPTNLSGSTYKNCATWHNGKMALRTVSTGSVAGIYSANQLAKNGNIHIAACLGASTGRVLLIDPTAASASVGLFV